MFASLLKHFSLPSSPPGRHLETPAHARSNDTNNRSRYRLPYTLELMPTFVVGFKEFAVPEMSENGFRVRCTHFAQFQLEQEIKGTLYFSDGTSLTLSCIVFRHDYREVVLRPLKNISFKRIIAEQRREIRHRQSL